MPRTIAWFSCGMPSAVCAKMLVDAGTENLVVARIHIASEHPDNERFADDIESWIGFPITTLRSKDFGSHWDVYEKTRYLVGPSGARCTGELKKVVRKNFAQPDDINCFGYTSEKREVARYERAKAQNFDITIRAPLIEAKLSKCDCARLIQEAGIKIPEMYRLGYQNNNCIGCVKGGMGYWNKIRRDFPDDFDRMIEVEADLGHTVLRKNGEPLPLKELDPDAGRYESLISGCGIICGD